RYLALLMRDPYFTAYQWTRDGATHAFCVLYANNGHLVAMLLGYDRGRPREDGLYRQVMMLKSLEAKRAGVTVNLSGGAGEFKMLRGASEQVEYDAVYDRHLPAWRRVGWRLVELQGTLWRRPR